MNALTVVVPCRDRAHLLATSLPHVTAALRPGDELLVVDAASRDEQVADVATAAGATVVRSQSPGASAARNAGWRAAAHHLVAFTDDDCRPQPGWAAAVVRALEELDAVCGRVLPEGDGTISVLDEPDAWDYGPKDDPATFGHGANLAVRRSALSTVGGWDARLGPGTPWPGGEDKDLLLRLIGAGLRVGYRPRPTVGHVQWRTRRASLRAELGYGRGVGALATKGMGPTTGDWARAALRSTRRDLLAGYQYGAAAGALRTAGILWGAASARRRLR